MTCRDPVYLVNNLTYENPRAIGRRTNTKRRLRPCFAKARNLLSIITDEFFDSEPIGDPVSLIIIPIYQYARGMERRTKNETTTETCATREDEDVIILRLRPPSLATWLLWPCTYCLIFVSLLVHSFLYRSRHLSMLYFRAYWTK